MELEERNAALVIPPTGYLLIAPIAPVDLLLESRSAGR